MPDWIAGMFRNASLLWWLPLALLPIVIHLLNRLRRRDIEWGAMQFLLASHAARSKRVLLEEAALLLIRVLVLALLVGAVARPFLKNPYYAGAGGARQDVAVVVDASGSMDLRREGTRVYERAVAAVGGILDSLAEGDTACLVVAGPTPTLLTQDPEFITTESRGELKRRLDGVMPTAGSADMVRAMDVALGSLTAGKHPHKQLVVVTDGQEEGWHTDQMRRWEFLRDVIDQQGGEVDLHVLTVGGGSGRVRNAAVTALRSDRRVVGTDRPVAFQLTVTNTGTEPMSERHVELTVEDRRVGEQEVGALQPGASSTAELTHQFFRPGSYLLRARLLGDDDVGVDDVTSLSVEVHERLGVLLVDGAPSERPLGSETSYIRIALDPTEVEGEPRVDYLADARPVEVADTREQDLAGYRVVVLANVPRVGELFLARLKQFVRDGGGLLVAPGDRVDLDWYRANLYGEGEGPLPAELTPPEGDAADHANPLRVRKSGSDHPAVTLSADPDETDVDKVEVYRRYGLRPADRESAQVVLRLKSGEPLLAERRFGRGRVLLSAIPLDVDWSNLPALKVYVVLVHELVQWLAAPTFTEWTVLAGQPLIARLAADGTAPAASLVGPDGRTVELAGERNGANMVFRFDRADATGVYRLTTTEGGGSQTRCFVVRPSGEESKLDRLDETTKDALAERVGISFVDRTDDLRARLRTDSVGAEVWQLLAAGVLLLLLGEVFLTRRITASRTQESAASIAFGQ